MDHPKSSMKRWPGATVIVALIALLVRHRYVGAQVGIEVRDAWSFPAVISNGDSDTVGAAYFWIVNRGPFADRLIRATSEVSRSAELHEMKQIGGLMRMTPVSGGLEIPSGETVKLEPGGKHLMLIGLKRPLSPGGHVKIDLEFEKAGTLIVEATVKGP
jgi:copper(I)-binding protein